MKFRMIVPILMLPFILLSAGLLTGERGGNTMAVTIPSKTANKVIPPIDKDVPAAIETATFAMG